MKAIICYHLDTKYLLIIAGRKCNISMVIEKSVFPSFFKATLEGTEEDFDKFDKIYYGLPNE